MSKPYTTIEEAKLDKIGADGVKCPDCMEPWKIGFHEGDGEVIAFCGCVGKDPEPITEWVGRFMEEQTDGTTTNKGYQ